MILKKGAVYKKTDSPFVITFSKPCNLLFYNNFLYYFEIIFKNHRNQIQSMIEFR